MHYSYLNDFTGFVLATRTMWMLIVKNAINTTTKLGSANINQFNGIRLANPWSQLLMIHQVNGVAMAIDATINTRYSLLTSVSMLLIDAPKTFRTPISLVR